MRTAIRAGFVDHPLELGEALEGRAHPGWRCYRGAVARSQEILAKVLSGSGDSNIGFNELGNLLTSLGFTVRIKGSHHIYSRPGVAEILNLQPKGSNAKPYQVKQVRNVIVRYKLGGP